jgi:hypothetical protein
MNTEKMDLPRLKKEAEYLAECRLEIDNELKRIESEILSRFQDDFKDELGRRGQEYGDYSFVEDEVGLKFSITKTVSWDSEKLASMAEQIPAEIRESLYKVKITIPEKEWNNIAGSEIEPLLTMARTVKYSEPKVTFK